MATVMKKVKALSVVSTREGFRRAGRAFGLKATIIPLTELDDDEVKLLKSEVMLVVTTVSIDVETDEIKLATDEK